ncbi:MAG TPA: flagellar hook capping FlgD N-terminal domain-containing protein [Aliidongia sp.]|nr:flagellar hook capping FlgD N-terminal domain-containing protein [Aliidongia sp.]
MSIPSSPSVGSNSSGSSANSQQAAVSSQFSTFLTLLTTELQNQDPTSPLDTNQFTSQLVQFSQLEQTLNTNTNLQTLIAFQQNTAVGNTLGYLGHTVEANTSNFTLDGTASATLNYDLPSNATSATITVLDSQGNKVGTFNAPDLTAGNHSFSFDGSQLGNPLPAGSYSYSIVADDASGTALDATTTISGTVTGVDTTDGNINLHIGSQVIPVSEVLNVTS